MKKLISLILIIAIIAAFSSTAFAAGTSFSDVPADSWFYEPVTALVSAGIVSGYADGTFRPSGTVTYGEALKLVLLAAGYGEQPKTGDHWASGYLTHAVDQGILYSADVDLNASISRLEIAQLVANSLGLRTASSASPFIDTDDSAAVVLYETGIINGTETEVGRIFKGSDFLKRSEISAIIYRMKNINFDALPDTDDDTDNEIVLDDGMTHVLVSCSGSLNIRSAPSTDSDVVGRIQAGRTAELISAIDGWYEVAYGTITGYVSSDYCTPVDYEVEAPSETVSGVRSDIVEFAKTFTGVTYAYGGASPSGFDCSGYVMYVFSQYGYKLDHSARAQYSNGTPIAKDELRPGDLVFFSNESTTWIGHSGIYIGDGLFIHASSGKAYCVTISALSNSWYSQHYIDSCRVIND